MSYYDAQMIRRLLKEISDKLDVLIEQGASSVTMPPYTVTWWKEDDPAGADGAVGKAREHEE